MWKILVLFMAGLASAAPAATVTVQVRGVDGGPVADAVVTIEGARAPAGPVRFPWPYVVSQQNISFQPHVLIVPVGATVSFPNLDKVRHHVYPFSKAKKFELKLYGHDETRSITFDTPGLVAIGCNIHDTMSGYIHVVDTPYAAKTDASGRAVIEGVPEGGATLALWSRAVHAAGNRLTQTIGVPAGEFARTIVIAP
jgi:plastocyanin